MTATTVERAASTIVTAALSKETLAVHLCNAYTLSLVGEDTLLREALSCANLNLPDGAPVAWLLRKHGTEGPIRGDDLLREVIGQGIRHGISHYFYGGLNGVAEAATENLRKQYPGLIVSGTRMPPFHDLSEGELGVLAREIESANTDVVWIGLGTPRQDYLVHALRAHLSLPLIPIGAAFDFEAGTVTAPPRWLRGTGLEWVYRLAKEPRRLWRRYLIGNPRFIKSLIRQRHYRAHTIRP